MSDESPATPSLRLKPRLRPPESAGPSAEPPPAPPGESTAGAPLPVEPAAPAVSAAPVEPPARIKLKPRLIAAPSGNPGAPDAGASKIESSAPAVAGHNPLAPAPGTGVAAAPIGTVPGGPDPLLAPIGRPTPTRDVPPAILLDPGAVRDLQGESGNSKLNPIAPAPLPPKESSSPTGSVPPPPPPAVPPSSIAPPPIAVIAAPDAPKPPSFPVVASTSTKAPVPHLKLKRDVEPPDQKPVVARRLPGSGRRSLKLALLAVAVVGLGIAAFISWSLLAPSDSEPPKPAAAPARPPAAAPVPPARATPSQPSSTSAGTQGLAAIPANAIRKAETAVQARAAIAGATNAILEEGTGVAATPARGNAPVHTAATTTELAPGVTATAQINASPEASAAFRAFVGTMKVAGVMGGSRPRALINGKLVRKGDTLDAALGIVFDGVNGNQLVFKDGSGAIVNRRY